MTIIDKKRKIIRAIVKHENMQSVCGLHDCYVDYIIGWSKRNFE